MTGSATLFTLDDPRLNAAEAPYTYFLPTPERLAAIRPGDDIKLVFRPTATGAKWDAERMWVKVKTATDESFSGVLNSEPDDIPGLHVGHPVVCKVWHVIAIDFAPEHEASAPQDTRRQYWERCVVDQAVLNRDLPVDYIYREGSVSDPEDKFPDSGWRIRGDMRNATEEEIDAREPVCVAIGTVLNADDSWLHLIDAPVGSAFRKNFETGAYIPVSPENTELQQT